MIESRLALTSRLSSWCPLQNKFCYQIRILFQPHHQRQVAAGQVGDHRGTWHQGDQVLPAGRGEGGVVLGQNQQHPPLPRGKIIAGHAKVVFCVTEKVNHVLFIGLGEQFHHSAAQFLHKVEREQARLAELQTEKSEVQEEISQLQANKAEAKKATKEAQTELRLLAPKLKNMEKLAAEYSSNPEELLPLPDRMESAKSYREKKSKPLLEKIVKVVRSVYRAYLDVCQKFELLQRKYDTEVPYLKKQLAEVKGENAELQETARDYDRLCRAYGPERVAKTVAAARQQEQAEKEQKRSQKRRHDRDAR